MATDLLTWVPRISSGLPYDLSGSTKYDNTQPNGEGSIDGGIISNILAGDKSGFSTPPTITQLNASSDINQIIGLCNLRSSQDNALYGTSIPALPYITPSPTLTVLANVITNLRLTINQLRTTEGMAAYSFITDILQRYTMKGCVIAELRKALALSGSITYNLSPVLSTSCKAQQYIQNENPFDVTETSVSLANITNADIRIALIHNSGGSGSRDRLCFDIPVPSYLAGGSVASIVFTFRPHVIVGPFTLDWYSSNSDDFANNTVGAFTGRPYNTNNILASIGSGSLTPSVDVTLNAASVASYIARAGGHWSTILALTLDVARGDPGSGSLISSTIFATAGLLKMVVTF